MKALKAGWLTSIALSSVLIAVVPAMPVAAARRSGYVTILFGRTQFTTVGGDCEPVPGAVDLDEVATDLAARGLTAVGTIVVDRTNESGFSRWGRYALEPDWGWIQARYAEGWRFVSAGTDYLDMTTLPVTDPSTVARAWER